MENSLSIKFTENPEDEAAALETIKAFKKAAKEIGYEGDVLQISLTTYPETFTTNRMS